MAPIRFSAALVNALAREALRQAAASIPELDLSVASSTASSAAARAGKAPLDAIIIDMSISDAESVVAQMAAGPDRSKLLLVSADPSATTKSFPVRTAQVLPQSNDPEDMAAILIERLLMLHPDRQAKARPTPNGRSAPNGQSSPNGRVMETTPAKKVSSGFKRREILLVGCSTGGPEALATFIGGLPKRFPVPVVVVQHMPPDFTRLLADRLDKSCALHVQEVNGTVKAKPGEVWIAPGHSHVKIASATGQIELDDGPEENNCRPAVDVLFRSAAATYGRRAVGVVLTGMGDDGARGGKTLADTGAYIVAQDEATSVVWGMPGAITRLGAVDAVLPLSEISGHVCEQFRAPVGAGA